MFFEVSCENGATSRQPFLRMTLTLKKILSRPQCCFRCGNRAKAELKGQFPTKDEWEWFSWIVFISTSLMPDLTSGLKGVSRVRQKCAESEHRCVPHVILRCRAVVPAAHRTPRSINHTYRLCACVCEILEPTPATNQHWSGQHGEVLMFLHVCTHTCEHVPALRWVETKEQREGVWLIGQQRSGGHYKEDEGKRVATKRQRARKKTNRKIQFKETGSSWFKATHTHTEAMQSDM